MEIIYVPDNFRKKPDKIRTNWKTWRIPWKRRRWYELGTAEKILRIFFMGVLYFVFLETITYTEVILASVNFLSLFSIVASLVWRQQKKRVYVVSLITYLTQFLVVAWSIWVQTWTTIVEPMAYEFQLLRYHFPISRRGLILAILTVMISAICQYYAYFFVESLSQNQIYTLLINLSNLICLMFFLQENIVNFYFLFEAILVPMFLLIGFYGSSDRKIHASMQLFFYTVISSMFMLGALLFIYVHTGASQISQLCNLFYLTLSHQNIIWMAIFFPLAVKVPLVPVHIWLPEAHVEAPTIGSVFLAAVVLKMGGFGILDLLFPLCPDSTYYYAPAIIVLCGLGSIYAGAAGNSMKDMKKVIAYSSVVHMSYITAGMFTLDLIAINAAVHSMFSHGLVSAGLFFVIGLLYDRYKSRDLDNYSGYIRLNPGLGFPLFLLILANTSFPGTVNYSSEFGIFFALFNFVPGAAVIHAIGLFYNVIYSMQLITLLLFGPNEEVKLAKQIKPLSVVELNLLWAVLIPAIILGLDPNWVYTCLDWDGYSFIARIILMKQINLI